MAGRDIDLLARKLVTLERQQSATSRATQLALSSVRLLDGTSVGISSGLEDSESTAEDLGILTDYTNDIATSLDEAIDFNDNVYDWIDTSKDAGEIGWDATEYAVDLANELETQLAEANLALDQAKLDLEAAEADIAQAKQDIIDAQLAADNAQESAEQAMTSADGKNTIYYSPLSTPPTPPTTGFKIGDTWFATIENNGIDETVIGRWDGMEWVQGVTLGTISVADAAITNAKVANLDAAKITTGYLSANRIEALSIVAEKLAADSVTADKIVAGAIVAGKLAADSVVASNIVGGTITGDKLVGLTITGDKIAANAITAGKIQAQAIDGMTITGALIRTAPSGQRMEFDVNGLRAFGTTGGATATLSAATGGLSLAGNIMTANGEIASVMSSGRTAMLKNGRLYLRDEYNKVGSSAEAYLTTSGFYGNRNSWFDFQANGLGEAVANTGLRISSNGNLGVRITADQGDIRLDPSNLGSGATIKSRRQPNILWSGQIYMSANQTASLTENVSDQLSGIVLVWSSYSDGSPDNSSWNTTFVPKNQVSYAAGAGVINNLMGWKTPVWKYVYLYNNRITGHADNSVAPNNTQVLRYVIGV